MATPPYAHRRDQLELPFGRISRPLIVVGLVVILVAAGVAGGSSRSPRAPPTRGQPL